MAAQNGTAVVIKVGSNVIAYGTAQNMKVGRATIDVSNKNSAGWKELIYGQGSWSMDGDFIFEENATHGFSELFTDMTAKTTVTVVFGTGTTGDKGYTGTALITSLDMSAPLEAAQTFKCSFEGTAAITETTF